VERKHGTAGKSWQKSKHRKAEGTACGGEPTSEITIGYPAGLEPGAPPLRVAA